MNGRLKCGWGCGGSFYNDDEKLAHERSCPQRRPRAQPAGTRPPPAAVGDGGTPTARTFD